MGKPGSSPGPIADRTFDLGFKMAVAGGIFGVVVLYWSGVLSITTGSDVVFTLTLFPVYLLAVAVLLGMWLGYERDASNLKRVTKIVDSETDESENGP